MFGKMLSDAREKTKFDLTKRTRLFLDPIFILSAGGKHTVATIKQRRNIQDKLQKHQYCRIVFKKSRCLPKDDKYFKTKAPISES